LLPVWYFHDKWHVDHFFIARSDLVDGNMSETILIRDLPPTLLDNVSKDLARYTIGFFDVNQVTNSQRSGLLGSGVLVSVGKTRAILTAHHVVEVLPTKGRMGLLLEKSEHPHHIDTQGVVSLKIARGAQDSCGPDIGVVILAQEIAGSIAAIKRFYSLDARVDQLLHNPPDLDEGFWVAQGILEEKSVITLDSDGRGMTKGFYNFTGVGGPEHIEQIGEYDYFEFPIS
jgi:hypothetical protein